MYYMYMTCPCILQSMHTYVYGDDLVHGKFKEGTFGGTPILYNIYFTHISQKVTVFTDTPH